MAMANVYDWTVQSKLTINALKTKSMLIGSKQNVTSNALNIVINNDIIDQVTSHKCLDVITDEALTWSPHVDYTTNKVSQTFRTLIQM